MKAALPDRIPATVLFREIKERGYEGGETRLKLFVRGLTPLSAAAPAVRFETTPGHQMQADWATVGRGADRPSLFIATLGWSRQAYVEFCDDERVETLIGCHRPRSSPLGACRSIFFTTSSGSARLRAKPQPARQNDNSTAGARRGQVRWRRMLYRCLLVSAPRCNIAVRFDLLQHKR